MTIPGIDERAGGNVHVFAVGRADDLRDGKAEPGRELVVAVVVARHGHDRAGAVAHEDEVRDPDRDLLPGHRVDALRPMAMPCFSMVSREASVVSIRRQSSMNAATAGSAAAASAASGWPVATAM